MMTLNESQLKAYRQSIRDQFAIAWLNGMAASVMKERIDYLKGESGVNPDTLSDEAIIEAAFDVADVFIKEWDKRQQQPIGENK